MSIAQWINVFDKFANAAPGSLIGMTDLEMKECRRFGWLKCWSIVSFGRYAE